MQFLLLCCFSAFLFPFSGPPSPPFDIRLAFHDVLRVDGPSSPSPEILPRTSFKVFNFSLSKGKPHKICPLLVVESLLMLSPGEFEVNAHLHDTAAVAFDGNAFQPLSDQISILAADLSPPPPLRPIIQERSLLLTLMPFFVPRQETVRCTYFLRVPLNDIVLCSPPT